MRLVGNFIPHQTPAGFSDQAVFPSHQIKTSLFGDAGDHLKLSDVHFMLHRDEREHYHRIRSVVINTPDLSAVLGGSELCTFPAAITE